MGIRTWLDKIRGRRDAAATERAEQMAVETPREEAVSSGDIEGMSADEATARLAGEASIEDTERLGD